MRDFPGDRSFVNSLSPSGLLVYLQGRSPHPDPSICKGDRFLASFPIGTNPQKTVITME
ncbi:hypothetical protein NG799_04740 [Laspinema sp. D1]|uniref:PilZ domain-containing protein n=1 Tax=Laspinema palackyanum D2a TaxID=2953684 RepID=A0ABT2MP21_9CYAN|nr:hypothetical protein [Laspinema sp. D2b]MCT7965641.1 hypothetical protein [Laspinema sp. D2a]